MDTNEYKKQLYSFRKNLWDEIAVNVATNLTFDKEEFLTYVTDQLTKYLVSLLQILIKFSFPFR